MLFEGTPSALRFKLGVSESTEIPISFITPLADVYVYEKDEARFELEISREPKNFRWLKGPQELLNDDKFELLVEGKKHILLIKSAKYEDEAKYTFEAEDKRTSGKLFIQGKPAWPYLEEWGPPGGNVTNFFLCSESLDDTTVPPCMGTCRGSWRSFPNLQHIPKITSKQNSRIFSGTGKTYVDLLNVQPARVQMFHSCV